MPAAGTGLAAKRAVLCAFAILSLVCALVAAPNEASPAQAERAARPKAAQMSPQARGREVYISNCARCHGGDGRGQTTLGRSVESPDMTDARWHARRSARRMTQSVARGRGQMPAFAGKLTRAEIAAAVAYVRTLRK